MPSVWVVIGLVVVALAGSSLLWWVMLGAHSRKQQQALLSRIEELEEQLSVSITDQELRQAPVKEEQSITGHASSSDPLTGWTSHISRILTNRSTPTTLAEQAVVAAYRRIEEPIRPADLADELCVSLRSLQRGLAVALDCSPGDLILTVKMREAKRMLEAGQLLVSEVAHHLGFSDAAHFTRRYRKFYRCTPSHHAGNTATHGTTTMTTQQR